MTSSSRLFKRAWNYGLCNAKPRHVISCYACIIAYRARREYWENHVPATGRPDSCAFSSQQPHYDLIPGHEDFRQQKEMTTEEEVKQLATRKWRHSFSNFLISSRWCLPVFVVVIAIYLWTIARIMWASEDAKFFSNNLKMRLQL